MLKSIPVLAGCEPVKIIGLTVGASIGVLSESSASLPLSAYLVDAAHSGAGAACQPAPAGGLSLSKQVDSGGGGGESLPLGSPVEVLRGADDSSPFDSSLHGFPAEYSEPIPVDFPVLEIDVKAARLKKMSSGVLNAARLIDQELQGPFRYFPWMITLTYRPGVVWDSRHISDCVRHYRRWADRHGFQLKYVWVAEIQERRYAKGGALLGECVHYHLLLWVPARLSPPKADKQGWWAHGMTQRVRVKRPIKYMMKYASKGGSVSFPKGLRIHGCGGLSPASRDDRRWWSMPRWVRALCSVADRPFRCRGGGFLLRSTGEFFTSIYEVFLSGGKIFCSLKNDLLDNFSIVQIDRLIESKVI
jgi:hypothetical protein